jgi:hypothetical protein
MSGTSQTTDQGQGQAQAHLLFCKSHVYVHPTPHSKDNIEGIFGVAEVSMGGSVSPSAVGHARDGVPAGDGTKGKNVKGTVVAFWIPTALAGRLGEEARYRLWEERKVGGGGGGGGKDEEDGVMRGMQEVEEGECVNPGRRFLIMGPLSSLFIVILAFPPLPDYVFVTLPSSTQSTTSRTGLSMGDYAFSVPLDQVYSLLVYPPTLSNWYGSITIK